LAGSLGWYIIPPDINVWRYVVHGQRQCGSRHINSMV
jgi:hypothetical protein